MATIVVFPPNFTEIPSATDSSTIIVNLNPDQVSSTMKELDVRIKRDWQGTVAFSWDGTPSTFDRARAKCKAAFHFYRKKCSVRFNN